MIIGIALNIFMARYFGPKNFGIWSLALTFYTIIFAVSGLGLKNIVIRELARSTDLVSTIMGNVFIVLGISGLLFYSLLICLGYFFISNSDPVLFLVISVLGLPLLLKGFEPIKYYYESKVESRYIVIASCIGIGLGAIIKFTLIYLKQPIEIFAIVQFLETIVVYILLFFTFKINHKVLINWKVKKWLVVKIIKDGYPLIISSIMVILYLRIDNIMLAQMISYEELGYYAVAVKLTEVWYFLPTILLSTFLPVMSKLQKENQPKFLAKLKDLFSMVILLSLAIALIMTVVGPPMIKMLYGAEYKSSIQLFIPLIWAVLFVALGSIRSAYLIPKNLTKIHMYTVVIGCLVNILMNLILIPKYQARGAVYSTLLAYMIAGYGSCFFIPDLRSIGRLMNEAFFSIPSFILRTKAKILNGF